MLKVILVSLHLDKVGGIENYIDLLRSKLNEKEHEVSHFVKGLKPKNHKRFTYLMPIITIYQFFKFKKKLKKEDPNVVHLNPSLIWADIIRSLFFLRIAKSMNLSVLFFIRGWKWQLYKNINENDFLNKIFVNNLKKADKILVLSKDFKNALIELGLDEDKIGLTSTMVESKLYYPRNKTFNKPYNILFCSRIAKDKGPNELIEAIPRVIGNEEDVNFIFMGDGPELENLKRKAKKMDIEKYVTFTGYKTGEEKYDIYKKSHLFAFPTYHGEGFPNVALEAMAAGLPIITTRNAGLKRLIEDGKNGFFLSSMPSDPEEIAENIVELIENPDLMEEMSELNMQEAKSKYNVEAVTHQIEKKYNEIAEKKKTYHSEN